MLPRDLEELCNDFDRLLEDDHADIGAAACCANTNFVTIPAICKGSQGFNGRGWK